MILRELFGFLKDKYDLSESEARALLEFEFKKDFSTIFFSDEQVAEIKLQSLKDEAFNLQQGYPLAYVLNEQDFYKYKFYVDANVLIPRPETEFLVDMIVKRNVESEKTPQSIVDIGAGSGCIGISFLLTYPESHVVFVENSPGAVAVTLRNLRLHKVSENRYSIFSDLADVEKNYPQKKFDLIVSNPPYIPHEDERVDLAVKMYEPSSALYADEEGFKFLKEWSAWAMQNINEQAEAFFEFGLGQEKELQKFSEAQEWNYDILKDQYNIDRFWFLKGK